MSLRPRLASRIGAAGASAAGAGAAYAAAGRARDAGAPLGAMLPAGAAGLGTEEGAFILGGRGVLKPAYATRVRTIVIDTHVLGEARVVLFFSPDMHGGSKWVRDRGSGRIARALVFAGTGADLHRPSKTAPEAPSCCSAKSRQRRGEQPSLQQQRSL